MAEFDFDIEDDFDEEDDSYGGQDTNLVRDLRKQLNKAKKMMKERDAELASLRGESRGRAIRDVLAARGVNPKIAAFVPADIEPSADAVASWLDEYGDIFGVASAAPEQPAANVDVDALARMSRAEEGAMSADSFNDLASRIANASSREELQALLRA